MSIQVWRRALVVGLLSGTTFISGLTPIARAQEENGRKVQTKIPPEYPDIARRMKIGGVVKMQLMVAPNGVVKDVKLVGGHPLLAHAAIDAVRRWHYEARPQATTENVEFRFDPSE